MPSLSAPEVYILSQIVDDEKLRPTAFDSCKFEATKTNREINGKEAFGHCRVILAVVPSPRRFFSPRQGHCSQ
jgi:hypothetical protein